MYINPLDWNFEGWAQKLRDIKDFIAEIVMTFAFLANWIPKYETIANEKLRNFYKKYVVTSVAALAFNWRHRLPSLDKRFGPAKSDTDTTKCGTEYDIKGNS